MGFKGTLDDFSSIDVLQLIALRKRSGLLSVQSSKEEITLWFDKGEIVFAESSSRRSEMRLGNILLKSGKLNQTALDRALEAQKETRRPLGTILYEMGVCKEEDISVCLSVQTKRTALMLFHLKGGSYDFKPQDPIEYPPEFVRPINVEGILMEGAMMIDEWPQIQKVVHSLDLVFRRISLSKRIEVAEEELFGGSSSLFSSEGAGGEETVKISAAEETVYELIDGRRTVRDVIDLTVLSEFACCKTFSELIQRGLIEEAPTLASTTRSELPLDQDLQAQPSADPSIETTLLEGADRWETARELIRSAMPDALLIELAISKKKAVLLQGSGDAEALLFPLLAMLEEILPFGENRQRGVFEYLSYPLGVSIFWDLRSDRLLATAAVLSGSNPLAFFRAHIATVARCVMSRDASSKVPIGKE